MAFFTKFLIDFLVEIFNLALSFLLEPLNSLLGNTSSGQGYKYRSSPSIQFYYPEQKSSSIPEKYLSKLLPISPHLHHILPFRPAFPYFLYII